MRIGFIGLGIMGRPMAGHLAAQGHQLSTCTHRSGPPVELVDAGMQVLSSPSAVAADAEVIILMLPDTPDVELVLFGPGGVIEGLAAGTTIIDMSSIDPLATRGFARRIEARGGNYLDAPVSGGEVGAKNAALTIMCGGEPGIFEAVRPILKLMGKNITLVGSSGAGQVAKVANQIVVALTIEAVGEALLFASKAGVDPAKVRDALMGGFAASRVLDVHGQRMIERSFEPGFRIRLHQKDLDLALAGARSMGLTLPGTAAVQQLLNACIAQGGGDWDHSAMVKALELSAAATVGSDQGS
ncbi:2-hydroxy-3-oxopropionate reductase [Sphingomonas sp. DBB INV C78]|uniref:2-hydroxy-3-oxopropionate reductase n=1 Tax=Sphingomonas sp. DBB INV C78 TaxID=3349434 RepID=UPI0036D39983